MNSRYKKLYLVVLLIISIYLPLPKLSNAEVESSIKQIDVTGNRRIETSTIISKISLKTGDTLSAGVIREEIQRLYGTDFFDDIRVVSDKSDDGVTLTFIVKERPILREVLYDGNEKITTDKLREKVTFITGVPVSQKQIKENVERLRELYREDGYYEATIIPVVSRSADDSVSVSFFIKEGKKIKIREIRVTGTVRISESSLLKIINTKRYKALTSWITDSGIFKEVEAQNDVDRIRDYYLDHGYVYIQVSGPEMEIIEGGQWMRLNFHVTEGEQFRIRNIDFSGNDIFKGDEIKQKIRLRNGMIFSRKTLRDDMGLITDMYGEKGYAFANVLPDIRPDDPSKVIDITFNIDKGEKITVRRINISGNEKTRDKVIRREVRLSEQGYLDTSSLKRSFQRLNNLNFFENVEIVPDTVSRDMVDLNIRVREKPTGAFSMGGGYSSVYGLVGMLDVTEGNLFGRGELLKLKGEFGELRTSYDITFKEPWFMDRPTSVTVNMFDTVRTFDAYNVNSRGGNIGLGRSFGEYWSGGITYGIQNITVGGEPPAGLEKGTTTTGSLITSVTRDTRDNYWDPRSGNRHNLSLEYADSFLGGDNIFAKYILDTTWYYPMIFDTAIMFHGRYGEGKGFRGDDLPANEKFYVGGIYTVRGFDYGRATTPSTVSGDPILGDLLGADKELIFNIEYIVPLVKDARINGVLFFDAGSGFGKDDSITTSDLRTSAGGGFRWFSPIGPLRLEWGYNLDPRPGERQGIWEFSIGSLF
ncbi:MAG: outer membrane protein assembly factor BamA [Nitrospirae bacterium]|nr:outer membrane protein assembly factor BamA [Nitrospirota bacterium]